MNNEEIIITGESTEEHILLSGENTIEHVIGVQQESAIMIVNKDYSLLTNKPSVNSVTLEGNKTSVQLGLQDKMDYLTNTDIERLIGD